MVRLASNINMGAARFDILNPRHGGVDLPSMWTGVTFSGP